MQIIEALKRIYIAKYTVGNPFCFISKSKLKSKISKIMMKIIILLCVLYFLSCVRGQAANKRPVIRCPNVFSYVNTDTGTVGKVTINFLPAGTHRVKVAFSQTPPIESTENAKLALYHTAQIVQGRLSRGEPIAFRVTFPTPGVIPKLTHIALDNRVLCTGTPYPSPSTNFELEDTISYSNVPNKKVQLITSSAPTAVEPLPTNGIENTSTGEHGRMLKVSSTTNERPVTTTSATKDDSSIQKKQQEQPNNSNYECGQEGNLEEDVLVPLILNGEVISKGQYPWMAAIKHKDLLGNWSYRCGGTLIGARVVLTAAHCLHDQNNQTIPVLTELGRFNIDSEREDEQIVIQTQKVLIHPDYQKTSFADADIGLVLLTQTVQFSQYVSPICLWSGSDDLNDIVGSMSVVAGWGIDESGVHSPLPKMIGVPIVSELECRKSNLLIYRLYTDRTFCAGKRDGSGPMKGDSGGALMIKRNDRWMMRGIVSVGIQHDKNEPSNYVVYCDVAKYGSWIRNNML